MSNTNYLYLAKLYIYSVLSIFYVIDRLKNRLYYRSTKKEEYAINLL